MVGLVRFELATATLELTVSQQERTDSKMKRTQKRTQEGRSIEAVREKLSSLTPEYFRWILMVENDEVCLSFFFKSDERGCFELRAKNWEGLMHRVAAIDWLKERGEVLADIEKQKAFYAQEVQS